MLAYSSGFSPSSAQGCSRSGSAAASATVSRAEAGTEMQASGHGSARLRGELPTRPTDAVVARWHGLTRRRRSVARWGNTPGGPPCSTDAPCSAPRRRRRRRRHRRRCSPTRPPRPPRGRPGAGPRPRRPVGPRVPAQRRRAGHRARAAARVHRVRRGRRAGRVVGTIDGVDLSGRRRGRPARLAVSPTFAADRRVFFYLTTAATTGSSAMRYVDGGLRDREIVLAGIPACARPTTAAGWRFGPDGQPLRQHRRRRDARRPQDADSLAARSCG